MSKAIKYGSFNSIIGLLIGIFITTFSIGKGYWIFIVGAPISAFLCGFYFWKLALKKWNEDRIKRLIFTGFLTGTVSHYLCWILLGVSKSICYHLTGNCISSLGEPPIEIWQTFFFAIIMTGWSFLFFGWITIPSAMVLGFLLDKK